MGCETEGNREREREEGRAVVYFDGVTGTEILYNYFHIRSKVYLRANKAIHIHIHICMYIIG